jgi:hypothetical protein
MVIQKTGVILLGFLVGLFLVVASWPYLAYQAENPTNGITGNSIRETATIFYDTGKEAASTFYETSSINQRIFILSQIFLLIIIIVAGFFIARKFRKHERLSKSDYLVHDGGKRSRTDLDILYEMLKKRRKVSMEEIEEAFKVDPGIALGWSKVLENGDLAELNYPRFGKPVLKLAEEEQISDVEEGNIEDVKKEEMEITSEEAASKEAGKSKKVVMKKVGKGKRVVMKKVKKKASHGRAKKKKSKGVSKKKISKKSRGRIKGKVAKKTKGSKRKK